ncbi:MAG: Ribonuclease, Rne/Rng family, partial [Belnapia sp.]|nr:Ribonuclease, Rne/Rng family [Belnapia sp.]
AAPTVLAALEALPGVLEEAAAALGQPLQPRPEPGRSWADWRIEEAGDG